MSRLYTLVTKIGISIRAWSEEEKLFALSLLFSSTLFIVPSNKIFLLVSFLFVAALYVILDNFTLAVLYAYIYLLLFQNGKGIDFLVVPGEYVYRHIPFVMTVNFTVSGALSALLLYVYIRNRKKTKKEQGSPRVDVSDILFGVFVIANIAACIISNIPWLSFLLMLQMCGYIFIFYFIQHQHLKEWVTKIIVPLTASLCILEGLWSGLQYINKGRLGYLNPTRGYSFTHAAGEDVSFFRMQGTFSHPNFLGFFMAFTVPVLLYYSVSRYTSRFRKIISAISCTAGVLALILSGSRASWLFFALGVILMFRTSVVRTSLQITPFIKRLYLTCIIIFAVTVPIIIIPRINQLAITLNPTGGAKFRLDLLAKSLIISLQNPFGVGLGMFPQILLEEIGGFTSAPTQPHNLIAQVLVASGFVGVISFFTFLYLKITMRYRKKTKESKITAGMHMIGIISLGIFLCLSMLYPVLTEQQIFGWLWILLSIVV